MAIIDNVDYCECHSEKSAYLHKILVDYYLYLQLHINFIIVSFSLISYHLSISQTVKIMVKEIYEFKIHLSRHCTSKAGDSFLLYIIDLK